MSPNESKLNQLRGLIETAEGNLRIAKQLLNDLGATSEGGTSSTTDYSAMANSLPEKPDENGQIVEGIFDGQNMMGTNNRAYPIPANYASKSKLVPGDQLKLTISENGSFIYKQIHPIERKHIKGRLGYEDGQYIVIGEGKSYKVLLASVTYFKAEVGDEITLIVPTHQESDWGAIENVIPRLAVN
jgi:hypothetical protein